MRKKNKEYKSLEINEESSDLTTLIKKELNLSIPIKKGFAFLNFSADQEKKHIEIREGVYENLVEILLRNRYGNRYIFSQIKENSVEFDETKRKFLTSEGILSCKTIVYIEKYLR